MKTGADIIPSSWNNERWCAVRWSVFAREQFSRDARAKPAYHLVEIRKISRVPTLLSTVLAVSAAKIKRRVLYNAYETHVIFLGLNNIKTISGKYLEKIFNAANGRDTLSKIRARQRSILVHFAKRITILVHIAQTITMSLSRDEVGGRQGAAEEPLTNCLFRRSTELRANEVT